MVTRFILVGYGCHRRIIADAIKQRWLGVEIVTPEQLLEDLRSGRIEIEQKIALERLFPPQEIVETRLKSKLVNYWTANADKTMIRQQAGLH